METTLIARIEWNRNLYFELVMMSEILQAEQRRYIENYENLSLLRNVLYIQHALLDIML